MEFDLGKRDTEEGRTELYNCLMGMVLDALHKTAFCIDICTGVAETPIESSGEEKTEDNLVWFWL